MCLTMLGGCLEMRLGHAMSVHFFKTPTVSTHFIRPHIKSSFPLQDLRGSPHIIGSTHFLPYGTPFGLPPPPCTTVPHTRKQTRSAAHQSEPPLAVVVFQRMRAERRLPALRTAAARAHCQNLARHFPTNSLPQKVIFSWPNHTAALNSHRQNCDPNQFTSFENTIKSDRSALN